LQEVDKAWLAGIIDGEGSIHISKVPERRNNRGYALTPRLTISNSNQLILSNVKRITACGTINRTKETRFWWKDNYVWVANSNAIRKILPQVLPYLVGKRGQASLLLRYLSSVKKGATTTMYSGNEMREMQRIYAKLRNLNKKGQKRFVRESRVSEQ
jgi:LAGLIDADG endonuclease